MTATLPAAVRRSQRTDTEDHPYIKRLYGYQRWLAQPIFTCRHSCGLRPGLVAVGHVDPHAVVPAPGSACPVRIALLPAADRHPAGREPCAIRLAGRGAKRAYSAKR
jgi:hypothetical protein